MEKSSLASLNHPQAELCTDDTIGTIYSTLVNQFKLNCFINNLAPGPGSYTAFSEFGIYQSKYANNKTENSNPSPRSTSKENK